MRNRILLQTKPVTPKKMQTKEVDYFWNHQKNIVDYDELSLDQIRKKYIFGTVAAIFVEFLCSPPPLQVRQP
jgi:hypothetical protein